MNSTVHMRCGVGDFGRFCSNEHLMRMFPYCNVSKMIFHAYTSICLNLSINPAICARTEHEFIAARYVMCRGIS